MKPRPSAAADAAEKSVADPKPDDRGQPLVKDACLCMLVWVEIQCFIIVVTAAMAQP